MKSTIRRALKLLKLIRNKTYRRGMLVGVAAAIEHEDVIRSIEIGSLIDIGANIGQFSLLTRNLHPKANIFAFEPLSAAHEKYARLFKNDDKVSIFRIAAGEEKSSVDMNVSGRADSSSILDISSLQNEVFPGTARVSVENVNVSRVDDVLAEHHIPGPIVIKLDVQGFELVALRGSINLLAGASHVYAEISFFELYKDQVIASELIAWLSGRGFVLSGIYNITYGNSGICIQADALFSRASTR